MSEFFVSVRENGDQAAECYSYCNCDKCHNACNSCDGCYSCFSSCPSNCM